MEVCATKRKTAICISGYGRLGLNLFDFNFWAFGPAPLWIIGIALLLLTYAQLKGLRSTEKVVKTLEKLTTQLEKDELRKATSELKADTFTLTNLIIGLTKQLEKVAESIEDWHRSMRKIYFWIPLGGNSK